MKKITIIIFSAILLFAGCSEEWIDINNDPNNPTEVNLNQILPGVVFDMAYDFSYDFELLGYITSVYTHQLVSRDIDNYSVTGAIIDPIWRDVFSNPFSDLNLLISEAEASDNLAYAGIGKIYKAYLASMMVDLWGDIPFSEFGNILDYPNPAFDDDQVVYEACFALLNAGIADLNNTTSENSLMPGADELIYGGDTHSWVTLANTIKLKLYNQVRLTSMYNATEVNDLLGATGDIISSYDDNFMLWFGTSDAPDNRNPGFTEYTGQQISTYISPWFYEIMTGQNADILNGVVDPRVPYYWCNQLNSENPDSENDTEYRDGNFVSIYFGSQSTARDAGGRSTFTMVGLYPVGGKYDDGTGGGEDNTLTNADAYGDAPYRFITYADVLFIKAELEQVGKVAGDPKVTLEAAIKAAFEQVDEIAAASVNEAPALDATDVSNYVAAVLAEYDAASADKQLEIIMTQKWISSFGTGLDQYTDYRRTGYPVLFDPTIHPHDGGPDTDLTAPIPVVISRGYPISLPWGQQELELNQNAPEQKVVTTTNLFWDI